MGLLGWGLLELPLKEVCQGGARQGVSVFSRGWAMRPLPADFVVDSFATGLKGWELEKEGVCTCAQVYMHVSMGTQLQT